MRQELFRMLSKKEKRWNSFWVVIQWKSDQKLHWASRSWGDPGARKKQVQLGPEVRGLGEWGPFQGPMSLDKSKRSFQSLCTTPQERTYHYSDKVTPLDVARTPSFWVERVNIMNLCNYWLLPAPHPSSLMRLMSLPAQSSRSSPASR